VLATTWIVSKVTGHRLVKPEVYQLLAKVSGSLLLVYVLAKSVDTLVWLNHTSQRLGAHPARFYAFDPFGTWVLFTEIVLLGLVPALLLALPRARRDPRLVVVGAFLACAGVVMNRFVMTVQTLALPTLAFDPFLSYTPSWQEVASFAAVLAYGVILYSLSFRYLRLFPQERELRLS
jgi:molybdopterin-containing oxidoreductase family membrane subunit